MSSACIGSEAGSSCFASSAYQAYASHQFDLCEELLEKDIECREDKCVKANLLLCQARKRARVFSSDYETSILELFPKLKKNGPACRAEAFAAFNLALSAYARGNRHTAITLIHSVLSMHDLPDQLFFVASLLEIEMSLTLCQPKLALKQGLRLRDNPLWHKASSEQRDYLDCIECRIRCRLAQTAFIIDLVKKPQVLQWCLIQSELDMKNGNGSRALSRLISFRPSPLDDERRLVDNAIGCVYALSLNKPEFAESYFRSAMLIDKRRKESWHESTIPRHCLIYHAALAQLHSGQPESAFRLFLAVLPFYPRQPRIWLRIAECCMHALTNKGKDEEKTRIQGGRRMIGYGKHRHILVEIPRRYQNKSAQSIECDTEKVGDEKFKSEISWKYAAHCVRNALVLTGSERDCVYLLPWLYAASAFINLNLGRHGLALEAAWHLANLAQVSPHHKLMAVLFKTEALVLLDRLQEAVECMNQAVPLQSLPSTTSAVIYNRALLQALCGNLQKSLATFSLLTGNHDIVSPPEATSLGIYLNLKLRNIAAVKRLIEDQHDKNRNE